MINWLEKAFSAHYHIYSSLIAKQYIDAPPLQKGPLYPTILDD